MSKENLLKSVHQLLSFDIYLFNKILYNNKIIIYFNIKLL